MYKFWYEKVVLWVEHTVMDFGLYAVCKNDFNVDMCKSVMSMQASLYRLNKQQRNKTTKQKCYTYWIKGEISDYVYEIISKKCVSMFFIAQW